MSLDQNLFTLTIAPRADEPHIVDLVDPRQVIHYRKERRDGVAYDFSVFGTSFVVCLSGVMRYT